MSEDSNVVSVPNDPRGKAVGLPRIRSDSPATGAVGGWFIQSLVVEAVIRDEVGQITAAEHALQRALELADRDRLLLPFLLDPVPDLLKRHARAHMAHADLISEILELRAAFEGAAARHASESLTEPLTETETRVLRLLATDLSKREIGNELYVSLNTVKTHVKRLYTKLDVRTRCQAVERARVLGLLTYSSRKPLSSGFHRR